MKMFITVGVPASGKTTWADSQYFAVNTNRDDIRQTLFGPFRWGEYQFTKEKENEVTAEQERIVKIAASQGSDVIISDTNINPKTRNKWEAFGSNLGYEVVIKLFHIDYHTAMERDNNREMAVGKKVMNIMFNNYHTHCKDLIIEYFKSELEKAWVTDYKTIPYILVDIDGTIADMQKGQPGKRKAYEWHRVGEDLPRDNVILAVKMFKTNNDQDVVFLSGRSDECFEETQDWLEDYVTNGMKDYRLVMRKSKDHRPDWVVKLELVLKIAERTERKPTLMFDDRDQVVEVMRSVGIEVWQVAPGAF